MLNLYPPFLFQRIRVPEVADDCRHCRVVVARSLLTRNLNGSTFGGSIFSAADPIYSILYWQVFARLGLRVEVWLKAATIRYLKPAKTRLTLDFRLEPGDVERAQQELTQDGRFERSFSTDAVDTRGEVCARVETVVHVRIRS